MPFGQCPDPPGIGRDGGHRRRPVIADRASAPGVENRIARARRAMLHLQHAAGGEPFRHRAGRGDRARAGAGPDADRAAGRAARRREQATGGIGLPVIHAQQPHPFEPARGHHALLHRPLRPWLLRHVAHRCLMLQRGAQAVADDHHHFFQHQPVTRCRLRHCLHWQYNQCCCNNSGFHEQTPKINRADEEAG